MRLVSACLVIGAGAWAASPGSACAQTLTAALEGRVVRADGTPVEQAVVGVFASVDSTTTSDSGRFVLRNLTPGAHVVWVRAVGFQPTRVAVTLFAAQPRVLTITVAQAVPVLPAVVTTAKMPAGYADVGLDKRMLAGLGQYLTYDQIVHRQAVNFTQLLQSMRGIKLWQNQHQFGATAEGTRGLGSCIAYVLDGVPQTQMMDRAIGPQEVSIGPESPDHLIDPSSVGAIEVYSSAARPAGFGTLEEHPMRSPGDPPPKIDLNAQQCDLVIIWTRARLGLTEADTAPVNGASSAASAHATVTATPVTIGAAIFPADSGHPCRPPIPLDTTRLNVYAIFESNLGAVAEDTGWIRYTDDVSAAFRRTFVLPSPLALPFFGRGYPALTKDDVKTHGLAVAPALTTNVMFTLGPTGTVLDSFVDPSSLSGDADTSALAAVQAAAATRTFPPFPAQASGRQSVRFSAMVTTAVPDPTQRARVVDQIDVPEWHLTRPVAVAAGGQPDLGTLKASPSAPPDSATFEFVVDNYGRAIVSTARAITPTAARASDPTYRGFVLRVAQLLPEFRFDPALVGTCTVSQIALQQFAD